MSALDVLENEVPESEYMLKYCDQNVCDHYRAHLQAAELGDPSGFQNYVTANSVAIMHEDER